jgi:hypothetical protein
MIQSMTTRLAIVASALLAVLGLTVLVAGCASTEEYKSEFKTALNGYYSSREECLWPESIKLPATAEGAQAAKFDALVDAGLLKREQAKGRRGARRAHEYELSDMGRVNWTADAARPGYGDFCFGHPQVNSVDTFQRTSGAGETKYAVSFHDSVMLPAWAAEQPIKKAFPKAIATGSGQSASATVVKEDNGWKVQNVSPQPSNPVG